MTRTKINLAMDVWGQYHHRIFLSKQSYEVKTKRSNTFKYGGMEHLFLIGGCGIALLRSSQSACRKCPISHQGQPGVGISGHAVLLPVTTSFFPLVFLAPFFPRRFFCLTVLHARRNTLPCDKRSQIIFSVTSG